jgi:hypothetical protein
MLVSCAAGMAIPRVTQLMVVIWSFRPDEDRRRYAIKLLRFFGETGLRLVASCTHLFHKLPGLGETTR